MQNIDQSESGPVTIEWRYRRCFFEKRGRAKYISHLDLMRAMSRAVRQAALPIWYTEGFHPHPYLSFPLPLPLGQEGLCEAMDLRLLEDIPFDEIAGRMNEILPEGMRVLRAAEPWCGPGEIASAQYEITLATGDIEQIRQRLAKGGFTAKKMGKQGHRKVEKEILLDPMIFCYTINPAANGNLHLNCKLAAGSEKNLNPALLVEALGGTDANIVRMGLFRKDGAAWE